MRKFELYRRNFSNVENRIERCATKNDDNYLLLMVGLNRSCILPWFTYFEKSCTIIILIYYGPTTRHERFPKNCTIFLLELMWSKTCDFISNNDIIWNKIFKMIVLFVIHTKIQINSVNKYNQYLNILERFLVWFCYQYFILALTKPLNLFTTDNKPTRLASMDWIVRLICLAVSKVLWQVRVEVLDCTFSERSNFFAD
jgi:hypothetical protein